MTNSPSFLSSQHRFAVSVVVPAFNEEKHLGTALQALVWQAFPRDRFEVIVVDNGSTDTTVEIARGFAADLNLQVLFSAGKSIAAVRNFGAYFAEGEVLAFLDADCFVPENWLEDALRVGSPKLLWGAHYLVPKDGTWVGKVWTDFQTPAEPGAVTFVPSGNLFLYKSSFEAIGRFNEHLETSEDVELCARARSHGMQVLAFLELGVAHGGTPRTLRRFYLQNRWHGKHVARMFLANLPRLKHLPLVGLSFYVLVLFWAAIAGLLFAVVSRWWVFGWVPLLLLLMPALLLALGKAVSHKKLASAPALFALYLTYLLARAAALLQAPPRTHR